MALAVFFVIGLLFLLTVNAKGIHAVPLAEAEEEVDEIQ
jgi:hypothetical protein